MLMYGDCEFRGVTERTSSSNGKKYYLLTFEDTVSTDQLRLYSASDTEYTIPRRELKKGLVYHCSFNYHYNSFQQVYQLDLTDIIEELPDE